MVSGHALDAGVRSGLIPLKVPLPVLEVLNGEKRVDLAFRDT